MDVLRARVTIAIVAVFLALLLTDALDDLALGNHWSGVPPEMFGLVGAILAGLYASQALRKNGNGNGKT